MTVIKNNAPGMRGVNTEDRGPVMLAPGESQDLKVSERELESVKAMGLEIDPETKRGEDEDGQLIGADTSVTTPTDKGSTIHPMPPGSDITQPETILGSGAAVAPWAMAGGTGSASQSPDQLPGGTQAAAATSEQQQNPAVVETQPKVEAAEKEKGRAAPKEKGAS